MKNTIEFVEKELNNLSSEHATTTVDLRKQNQKLLLIAGMLLGVLINIGNGYIEVPSD